MPFSLPAISIWNSILHNLFQTNKMFASAVPFSCYCHMLDSVCREGWSWSNHGSRRSIHHVPNCQAYQRLHRANHQSKRFLLCCVKIELLLTRDDKHQRYLLMLQEGVCMCLCVCMYERCVLQIFQGRKITRKLPLPVFVPAGTMCHCISFINTVQSSYCQQRSWELSLWLVLRSPRG